MIRPDRRAVLTGTAATLGLAALGGGALWYSSRALHAGPDASGAFPVSLSRDAWQARLTAEEFAVLRLEETEPPFSSPLDKLWDAGTYVCAGCANPLYASEHKFDSGTGWPSFWQAIAPDAVGTRTDYKLLYPRTEVHCARCGGHQGHIFADGPAPTGQRHCINGVALDFVAA